MSRRHALIREIAPFLPENALRAFDGLPDLAFLDSGTSPSDLARWSFVAADPFARFEKKMVKLSGKDKKLRAMRLMPYVKNFRRSPSHAKMRPRPS